MAFKLRNIENYWLGEFDLFNKYNIKLAISTRLGIVSANRLNSWNMGFNVGNKEKIVIENRKKLLKLIGADFNKTIFMQPIHGDIITIINRKDADKNISWKNKINKSDGLITNVREIAVSGIFADCVPVFLFAAEEKVVAIIHAGWRGTSLKISAQAVNKMVKEFKCKPENIIAGIGPSIGQCCLEVSNEVLSILEKSCTDLAPFSKKGKNNNFFVDLCKINEQQLKDSGLVRKNIEKAEICTCCNNEIFFSYRKEQKNTGRFLAIISL